MATGLDIAAGALGIVGVAQQLTESVFKIKCFVEDVKHAPIELIETIRSLDNTAKMLIRLGEDEATMNSSTANADIFSSSLELYRNAVARIAALAMDLHTQTKQHRRWGAVKTVLKRRNIQSLLGKLQSGRAELHFAHSLLESARLRRRHETLQEILSEQRDGQMLLIEYTRLVAINQATYEAARRGSPAAPFGPQNASKDKNGKSTRPVRPAVRIKLPIWLCQYAMDISIAKAAGNWTLALKTYKILAPDSEAWRFCELGDLTSIRTMLDDRQLSIHDRFEEGHSLFSLAVYCGHIDIARLLIHSGASADWESGQFLDTFSLAENPFITSSDQKLRGPLYLQDSDDPTEVVTGNALFLLDVCGDEMIKHLDVFAKPFRAWTVGERLTALVFGCCHRPEMFSRLIADFESDFVFFNMRGPEGLTVLHTIAWHWALSLQVPFQEWHKLEQISTAWSKVLAQVIKAGANIMCLRVYPYSNGSGSTTCTALQFMLLWLNVAVSESVLQFWSAVMLGAGVDLIQYGEAESEGFKAMLSQAECSDDSGILRFHRCGVTGLAFGPTTQHWHFWIRHPGDVFAGMFWKLIESPERTMPGGWIMSDAEDLQHEDWIFRPRSREYGVKRKAMRRLRRRFKAPQLLQPTAVITADLVTELQTFIEYDAECCRTGNLSETYYEKYDRFRALGDRMIGERYFTYAYWGGQDPEWEHSYLEY